MQLYILTLYYIKSSVFLPEEFVMTKKQLRNTVSFIVFMIIFLKIIHASVQTIMYMECAVIIAAILLIVECLSEHLNRR